MMACSAAGAVLLMGRDSEVGVRGGARTIWLRVMSRRFSGGGRRVVRGDEVSRWSSKIENLKSGKTIRLFILRLPRFDGHTLSPEKGLNHDQEEGSRGNAPAV